MTDARTFQPAVSSRIPKEHGQAMATSDTSPRVIAFLRSCSERERFIARHVQLLGYCDPHPDPEVGLRERVAYILTEGCRTNAPAASWTVESDARKRRLEAREAALLAEAFDALPPADWRALIDACASGPVAAHSLASRWEARTSALVTTGSRPRAEAASSDLAVIQCGPVVPSLPARAPRR